MCQEPLVFTGNVYACTLITFSVRFNDKHLYFLLCTQQDPEESKILSSQLERTQIRQGNHTEMLAKGQRSLIFL